MNSFCVVVAGVKLARETTGVALATTSPVLLLVELPAALMVLVVAVSGSELSGAFATTTREAVLEVDAIVRED